jgi:hypothetical protein
LRDIALHLALNPLRVSLAIGADSRVRLAALDAVA